MTFVALAAPNLAHAAVEMRHGTPYCVKSKNGRAYCQLDLLLKGAIDQGMATELKAKLQQAPGTITSLDVLLDSPGGAVGPAMEIGRLLRRFKAHTGIDATQNHMCVSACVLVYAAGVVRGAEAKRLGIHRPYLEVDAPVSTMFEIKALTDRMQAELHAYLAEMNVNPQLADDMMRIPPDQVHYLTYDELDAYGLGIFDPVWQEQQDLAEARRLGISRQEYMRRQELAMKLCQPLMPDESGLLCREHYMSGNDNRFVPPVPRRRKECEGKFGLFADLFPPGCIDGRNVASAKYDGGIVQMIGKGQWLETDTDGNRFRYAEERRDDKGVLLFDNARGIRLYIDANRRQIFYANNRSSSMRPLYSVTELGVDKYFP